MKHFCQFIQQLSQIKNENQAHRILVRYFESIVDEDNKICALKLLLSATPKRITTTKLLKEWTPQITGLPEWLIKRSEEETGNFINALALLLRPLGKKSHLSLSEWLIRLSSSDAENESQLWDLIEAIRDVSVNERILLLKLMTGTFKSPTPPKTVIFAIAEYLKTTPQKISLRLYRINLNELNSIKPLRNPTTCEDNLIPDIFPKIELFENELTDLLNPTSSWRVIGKKDGISVQIVKYEKTVILWSLEGEILNEKFPEIIMAIAQLPSEIKVLGQILPKNPSQSVEKLYGRLNKKNISNKELLECPATFEIWEALDFDEDFEELCRKTGFNSAEWIYIENPDQLNELHKNCRKLDFSGLLIQSIERKNQLFYRKASCYSIKAILTYVELDNLHKSGIKMLGFGVFNESKEIIPIAKTEAFDEQIDISEIVEFTKQSTIERFGPVRTITPELVFELHFDSIAQSKRRKSGLMLSNVSVFKKINATPDFSDTLEAVRKLLN